MTDSQHDDLHGFVDYARIINRHRILVFIVGSVVFLASIAIALIIRPVYKSSVTMVAVSEDQSAGGLSSVLSQFGGLASVAGIDLPGNADTATAIAVLKSKAFTYAFIEEENLLPVLFEDDWDSEKQEWTFEDKSEVPTLAAAYRLFDRNVRTIGEDTTTGIITLSIYWHDRDEAARWANVMVARANETLRARALKEATSSLAYLKEEVKKTQIVELREGLYRLIEGQIQRQMLINVREHYAFDVIDPAVAADPRDKEKPKRFQIALLGIILGGLFGIFAALTKDFLRRVNATP